ncbi:MAG: ester cyclase [Chloroflexaceae bacterium]|jgi:steroid delta-isomerase-like uncharacterized protein|nr:ester cyclase [Chloroflexaceae bacterium]
MKHNIKSLTQQLTDAWNQHDVDKIVSFYAPAYVGIDVGQARTQRGPEDIRRSSSHFIQAFPDVYFASDIVAQGDRTALIWLMRGTHQGPLMRVPPTGRVVEFRGVSILTFEQGQVIHGLYIWDMAAFLRAVGLLPELG